jgi:hypothetical protein
VVLDNQAAVCVIVSLLKHFSYLFYFLGQVDKKASNIYKVSKRLHFNAVCLLQISAQCGEVLQLCLSSCLLVLALRHPLHPVTETVNLLTHNQAVHDTCIVISLSDTRFSRFLVL